MSRSGAEAPLEHRDGVPTEHHQTWTVSRQKAVAAVLGWVKGESVWKAAFMWNNIGSCFEDSGDSWGISACPRQREPGDRLVFVSDGVHAVASPKGEAYGEAAL
ncbi:hypothetical protein AB0L48_29110, partial [Streptomyces flaveolus]